MTTHVTLLPAGVMQTLSAHLNSNTKLKSAQMGTGFLRLPHPRTGVPSLFLPHQVQDPVISCILDVQIVAPTAGRSWFMDGSEVIADGKLLLMTPVDPVFLVIRILQAIIPSNNSPGNFRTMEDIFEAASDKITSEVSDDGAQDPSQCIAAKDIICLVQIPCIQTAMQRICDFKDVASDLTVYRFSRQKLVDYLVQKVNRLSKSTIIENTRTLSRELAKDGLLEGGKEVVLIAGRLKGACDLIAQYVPDDIHVELLAKYDFKPLEAHLEKLRDEDMASAQNEARAAKAKPNQDDKKRKASAQPSKGVDKLKKANINGMAKLSSFFQKPQPSKE